LGVVVCGVVGWGGCVGWLCGVVVWGGCKGVNPPPKHITTFFLERDRPVGSALSWAVVLQNDCGDWVCGRVGRVVVVVVRVEGVGVWGCEPCTKTHNYFFTGAVSAGGQRTCLGGDPRQRLWRLGLRGGS
jgi:hypothetical protein